MPDFDFDAFNHDTPYERPENNEQTETESSEENNGSEHEVENEPETPLRNCACCYTRNKLKPDDEEVDKW